MNQPDGVHGLPAVILAEVLGYASGTHEFDVTVDRLAEAISTLAPAEAATDIDHPNLGAWRQIAAQPRDSIAVFVGSLDDAPAGPADAALRELLSS